MSDPTVSTVLPTRNRAESLAGAVASVLSQNLTDLELIIIDGASTDNTREVVESYTTERIRYIRNEEPRGVSAARNAALDLARGDYIAFIDDDDIWLPWKLDVQVKLLETAPDEVGLLASAFFDFDVTSGNLSIYLDERDNSSFGGVGVPTRWLLKRKVLADIESFDESMGAMEDLDFSGRLRTEYDVMYNTSPVAVYYNREDSQPNRDIISGREQLIAKHGETMSDRSKSENFFHLATSYIEMGEFQSARNRSREAIRLDRTNPKYYAALLVSASRSRRVYYVLKKLCRSFGFPR